jgi:hypothetical protein
MSEKPLVLQKFRELVLTSDASGWQENDFWNVYRSESSLFDQEQELV